MSFCAYCRTTGADIQRCSRCKSIYYCSKDCQRKHWRKHKATCVMASQHFSNIFTGQGDCCDMLCTLIKPRNERQIGSVKTSHSKVLNISKKMVIKVARAYMQLDLDIESVGDCILSRTEVIQIVLSMNPRDFQDIARNLLLKGSTKVQQRKAITLDPQEVYKGFSTDEEISNEDNSNLPEAYKGSSIDEETSDDDESNPPEVYKGISTDEEISNEDDSNPPEAYKDISTDEETSDDDDNKRLFTAASMSDESDHELYSRDSDIWNDFFEDPEEGANKIEERIKKKQKEELRLVLVGKTGDGKSATGNTLLGRVCFLSKVSASSITQGCKTGIATVDGRILRVVDTPGQFDTNLSPEKVDEIVVHCVAKSIPGPHAILLVVQIGKFTPEVKSTFDYFVSHFGNDIAKYAIIVFTKVDQLKRDKKTTLKLKEYIESAPVEMQQFIKMFGNRYIGFDNTADLKVKKLKVRQLIQIVNDLVHENGGSNYTNEMYEKANAALLEDIKRQKFEQDEKIRQKINERVQEISDQNNKLLEEKFTIIKRLESQINDINSRHTEEMKKMKEEFENAQRELNESINRYKDQITTVEDERKMLEEASNEKEISLKMELEKIRKQMEEHKDSEEATKIALSNQRDAYENSLSDLREQRQLSEKNNNMKISELRTKVILLEGKMKTKTKTFVKLFTSSKKKAKGEIEKVKRKNTSNLKRLGKQVYAKIQEGQKAIRQLEEEKQKAVQKYDTLAKKSIISLALERTTEWFRSKLLKKPTSTESPEVLEVPV